jgi:hypothetical protein
MPVYEYWCPVDREVWSTVKSIAEYGAHPESYCPSCGGFGKREFSVQIAPVMQEHYNPSFGMVSDPRDYQRALDAKAREATERTGIEHKYGLADPMDTKTLGVDDQVAAEVKARRR